MNSHLKPKSLQYWAERALLATRFVIVIPVVVSVFLALAAVYVATVDALYTATHLIDYASGISAPSATLRVKLLTSIIKAFDTYLIGAVLLIFAIGLYELFIHRLEAVEHTGIAGRLLFVRDLDDLKNRLARLVLLVLVVEVLQQALQLSYTSLLDVLYLAIATLLVGGAIFLSNVLGERAETGAGTLGRSDKPAATDPPTLSQKDDSRLLSQ